MGTGPTVARLAVRAGGPVAMLAVCAVGPVGISAGGPVGIRAGGPVYHVISLFIMTWFAPAVSHLMTVSVVCGSGECLKHPL